MGGARLISSARRMLEKMGPGRKTNAPFFGSSTLGSGDIVGQEVGGELHPLELEPEGGGERLRHQRLPEPRKVLEQEVAIRHEPDEDLVHRLIAAHDREADGRTDPLGQFGGFGGLHPRAPEGEGGRPISPGGGVRTVPRP